MPLTPASVRYFNPGGMYPGPSATLFGSPDYATIGGGHKIAIFPDPESGAAAQFDLLAKRYSGLPLRDAVSKWSGGNSSSAYLNHIVNRTGLTPDTVLTPELLRGPQGVNFTKAAAEWEAGRPYPMTDDQWRSAQARAFGSRPPQPPVAPMGMPSLDPATPDPMTTDLGGFGTGSAPAGPSSTAVPAVDEQGPQTNAGPVAVAAQPQGEQGGGMQSALYSILNPITLMGLSILGAPHNNWGSGIASGAKAAQSLSNYQIKQAAFRDYMEQRNRMRQAWAAAFPNGQPNMEHPLLKGASPELAATIYAEGPEAGLKALQTLAMERGKAAISSPKDEAMIAAYRARAGYYDAASQAQGRRAGAYEYNAQTKRLNAYGDLIEKMGYSPTQEQWEAENKPGGVVYAAFGGPQPFEEAPTLLQQARVVRQQAADNGDDPFTAAGMTPEQAKAAKQQQSLKDIYGRPPQGQRWTVDGNLESIPGAGNTASERQSTLIAKQSINILDDAADRLTNANRAEQLFGDKWMPDANGRGGYGGFGDAGRGFRGVRGAVMNLTYALSGKQVSNAERDNFMDIYMPSSLDSRATQEWKINTIRQFFNEVIKARESGKSDEDVANMWRKKTNEGLRGMPKEAPNSVVRKKPSGSSGDGFSWKKLD
jgi:hypothetical protein